MTPGEAAELSRLVDGFIRAHEAECRLWGVWVAGVTSDGVETWFDQGDGTVYAPQGEQMTHAEVQAIWRAAGTWAVVIGRRRRKPLMRSELERGLPGRDGHERDRVGIRKQHATGSRHAPASNYTSSSGSAFELRGSTRRLR